MFGMGTGVASSLKAPGYQLNTWFNRWPEAVRLAGCNLCMGAMVFYTPHTARQTS